MTEITFALKWSIHGQLVDTAYKDLESVAVAADDLGFDGVYVVDHLFLHPNRLETVSAADPHRPFFLEAFTALAAIAAVTKKVKVGPQVTPVSLRHPVFIAKMGATIDHVSNGRFVLQLGTGWHKEEYQSFGFEWDDSFAVRYDKMIEGLEVIKRLWTTDGPANYEGKYYRLQDAPFWPKPVQKPHPPIWFGGSGKKTRAAVAKFGDCWTPAMPHYGGLGTQEYTANWAEIQAGAEAAGRRKEDIVPGAMFFTAIDEDRSAALERASRVLRRESWSTMTMEEVQQAGTVIAGTPDDCVKGIQRFVDAGVRYFTLTFLPITDHEGVIRQLSLYNKKVFPHFQG